jgi:hypothetical protein
MCIDVYMYMTLIESIERREIRLFGDIGEEAEPH